MPVASLTSTRPATLRISCVPLLVRKKVPSRLDPVRDDGLSCTLKEGALFPPVSTMTDSAISFLMGAFNLSRRALMAFWRSFMYFSRFPKETTFQTPSFSCMRTRTGRSSSSCLSWNVSSAVAALPFCSTLPRLRYCSWKRPRRSAMALAMAVPRPVSPAAMRTGRVLSGFPEMIQLRACCSSTGTTSPLDWPR